MAAVLKGSGKTPDMLSPATSGYYYSSASGPFILPYPMDTTMIETVTKYSPVAAAVIQNIRNECWREDLEIIPKFGARCPDCGREYEDGLEAMRIRGRQKSHFEGPEGEEPGGGDQKICGVCGHKWYSRVPRPLRCPNCGAYDWGGGPGPHAATKAVPGTPASMAPPEYQSEEEVPVQCEDCGGQLEEPDEKQRKKWEDFFKMRNTHGLDFPQVAEILTDDITKFDDAYLIYRWEYVIGPDGEIAGKTLVEVFRGAPTRMRMIKDERDRRGEYMVHADGQGYFTCPIHRANNVKNRPGKCAHPGCNCNLQPAEYVALSTLGDEDILFIAGEVRHWSEYAPSESYGFSPILTCWSELKCLVNISRLAGSIYEQFRPPKGYLVFRTRNFESLQTQLLEAEEKLKTNPVYIPKLAVESEAGERFVEWLPLTNDFNELQTIPLMKELRERIEAVFGVSNMMMADTSASGGLNNEGLQITVTLRTIERRQHVWEAKILPELLEALEITDYRLRFPPPVEEDRMAVLERRRINLELIERAMKMGARIEIVNDEDFEFKLTSPITHPSDFMMMGDGTVAAPGDPRNPNAGGEDNGGPPGGSRSPAGSPGKVPRIGEREEKSFLYSAGWTPAQKRSRTRSSPNSKPHWKRLLRRQITRKSSTPAVSTNSTRSLIKSELSGVESRLRLTLSSSKKGSRR
jgi:hypothetical protein